MFHDAALLFLLQAAELPCLTHSCLLSYWNLPYCIPQQFNETVYSQFPVGCLAAGLLRYYSKNPVLAHPAPEAARDKFLILKGEAW